MLSSSPRPAWVCMGRERSVQRTPCADPPKNMNRSVAKSDGDWQTPLSQRLFSTKHGAVPVQRLASPAGHRPNPPPTSRYHGARESKATAAALAEAHRRGGFKNTRARRERGSSKTCFESTSRLFTIHFVQCTKRWTRIRTLEKKFNFQE